MQQERQRQAAIRAQQKADEEERVAASRGGVRGGTRGGSRTMSGNKTQVGFPFKTSLIR